MATIGAYTVTTFLGRLQPAGQKIAVLSSAPGVDGMAIVKGGWSNRPQAIPTITQVASSAIAATLLQTYRAQHGLVIQVVDQFSITWPNVTVLGVNGVIAAVGYGGLWRLEADWLLLPDTTRPAGL